MGEQLCGPQHQGQTCSVVRSLPVRVGTEGAEPLTARRRPMDAVKNLKSQPPRTLRRMGRGTYRRVTTGTGGALPGPVTCEFVTGKLGPITGSAGKWIRAGWAWRGGRSTAGAGRTTKPPVREGPLLRRCVLVVKEEAR